MSLILVIDDSSAQNAWMRSVLCSAGHQVQMAVCLQDALALIEVRHPALCLVELIGRASNGFETAVALKKVTHAPVVLMTGRRLEADSLWAETLGVRRFLYRPCTKEALLQQLDPEPESNDASR